MNRLTTPAHLPVALLSPDTPSPWGSVAPHSERLAAYRALLGRTEPAAILPQQSRWERLAARLVVLRAAAGRWLES